MDTLKAAQNEDDPYKEKYEKEHSDFEAFKKEVAEKDLKAQKDSAYRALLKKAGVSEKRIDTIMKVTILDEIEMDDNGIVGADKIVEDIKAEYPEFIVTEETKGADTETPPENNGGNTFEQMSVAEKMKYANEHPSDKEVIEWLK